MVAATFFNTYTKSSSPQVEFACYTNQNSFQQGVKQGVCVAMFRKDAYQTSHTH